jgi:hypothetical protein
MKGPFSMNNYTREQLLVLAKLTAEDLEEIDRRRRDHNANLPNSQFPQNFRPPR